MTSAKIVGHRETSRFVSTSRALTRVVAHVGSVRTFEWLGTDVLAGCVLARASAGLTNGTIRGDVGHLEQVRTWLGRPLWDMEPADADAYFGRVLRGSPGGTRLARSRALSTYFLFLELRHKVEIHRMTGRGVECPIERMVGDLCGCCEAGVPRGADRTAVDRGRPFLRAWNGHGSYGHGMGTAGLEYGLRFDAMRREWAEWAAGLIESGLCTGFWRGCPGRTRTRRGYGRALRVTGGGRRRPLRLLGPWPGSP
jgi:hypothetical protein